MSLHIITSHMNTLALRVCPLFTSHMNTLALFALYLCVASYYYISHEHIGTACLPFIYISHEHIGTVCPLFMCRFILILCLFYRSTRVQGHLTHNLTVVTKEVFLEVTPHFYSSTNSTPYLKCTSPLTPNSKSFFQSDRPEPPSI